MSLFLYRLGQALSRHRGAVVAGWLLVVVALGGAAAAVGTQYDDAFSIPGTESQQGQDVLEQRFGLDGATGTAVLTVDEGRIDEGEHRREVRRVVEEVDGLPRVSMTVPWDADDPEVSDDGQAVLVDVAFKDEHPDDEVLDAVQEVAEDDGAVSLDVGGAAYDELPEPGHLGEVIGLLVALVVIAITLGSVLAAGVPLLTAIGGVGATMAGIVLASSVTTISSTAPTLAMMLGLAVGIDYALFLLARHRAELAGGLAPPEAVARAMATAGSAVVFAGATVVIALCGLMIAGIPLLTVMGLAAAAAVAVAVVVALTLVPALCLLLGERLRPRVRVRRRRFRRTPRDRSSRTPFATRWVRAVTRWPLVTVALVVVGLGAATLPVADLELNLPDASSADTTTPQRQTFDAVTEHFGPGWNAPLIVEATIVSSDDPVETVDDLADEVRDVPGVEAVPVATPNEAVDTALVRVIPEGGQTDPATADLVHDLRERSGAWEDELGVSDIRVAGTTAVNIDVSERLTAALLPFGLVVVGLSLVLLMMVFRSVAVPLKATLGYLLSVGSSLGIVVGFFQLGWLGLFEPAPIVSFLPLFLMGVLFGLAMDYEMFLVSRMREDVVHTGDPAGAVERGFQASARVVAAAAIIMVAVFAAFVPAGSSTIQPIAFGLAVGVFIDAFVVRMTLVPAVLALLGHRAWWLPRRLERLLPDVDVEGAALERLVAHQEREALAGPLALHTRDLVVDDDSPHLDVSAPDGVVSDVVCVDDDQVARLALVLTGRRTPLAGELAVGGLLLPEQRGAAVERIVLLDTDATPDDPDRAVRDRAALRHVTRRGRRRFRRDAVALLHQADLDRLDGPGRRLLVEACLALAGGASVLVVEHDPGLDARAALAALDATVLVLRTATHTLEESLR